MATPALSSRLQSALAEYGVFWQLWPQFEQTGGERRLVGLEVELIGFHRSDLNHLDPSCRMCHRVRSVLRAVADRVMEDVLFTARDHLNYGIDSHSNSILCLPALGNRSAVSVSISFSWYHAPAPMFEADLQTNIKTLLARYGIHQR